MRAGGIWSDSYLVTQLILYALCFNSLRHDRSKKCVQLLASIYKVSPVAFKSWVDCPSLSRSRSVVVAVVHNKLAPLDSHLLHQNIHAQGPTVDWSYHLQLPLLRKIHPFKKNQVRTEHVRRGKGNFPPDP